MFTAHRRFKEIKGLLVLKLMVGDDVPYDMYIQSLIIFNIFASL